MRFHVLFLVSFLAPGLFVGSSCTKGSKDALHTLTRTEDGKPELPAQFKGYEGRLPDGVYEHPEMLPAYMLPSERKVIGKADASDDYRDAHKEWFAITIPTSDVEDIIKGMVEWEPMQALLLTLSGNSLGNQVDQNLADMTYGSVHTAGVPVYLLYTSENHKQDHVDRLEAKGVTDEEMNMVHFVYMEHGSVWMIDYGPFPIKNGSGDVAFVDFRYYHGRHVDDGLPTRIGHEILGIDTFRVPINFEGGNLQMDSMGTCYATTGLTSANSDYSLSDLTTLMGQYLGCTQLVILNPLADEGTTHIDMFFKLVDDHTAVLGSYTSQQDPENKALLDENQAILEAVELPDGSSITVHRMPMPSNGNHQVWRTYINSTFVKGPKGGVNLWPTYSIEPELEAQALAIWQEVMPDWVHQKVLSDTVITWGGAMHCISRTVPVGNNVRWVDPGSCGGDSCTPANNLGYDGSCDVSTGCSGPKWLCDNNDCAPQLPDSCNEIQFEGCCSEGNLVFCQNNELQNWDCNGNGCGWHDQNGFYDCGQTGEGPSEFPIDCPAPCAPSCDGKQCGDDGCGGDCGSCGAQDQCESGQCVADNECGDVNHTGCCDGGTLFWCEDNQLKTKDCGSSELCGWDGQNDIYNCQFSGAGPEGFPKDCVGTCVPDCASKTCGEDGCGGTCGSCSEGSTCTSGACVPDDGSCGSITDAGFCAGDTLMACTAANKLLVTECSDCCGWIEAANYHDCLTSAGCDSCTPQCGGRSCGNDGCGGICGLCASTQTCEDGLCVGGSVPTTDSGPPPGTDAGDSPDSSSPGPGSSSGCSAQPGPRNTGQPWGPLLLILCGLFVTRSREILS
jgi:agmatine/peptidylarginine deiminase